MIDIFLIESQKIVREGLKVLLDEEEDFQVFISENKDVKISQINCLKPDLIVISLDNMDESDFSYLSLFLDINKNLYQLRYLNPVKIIVYASRVNEFILNRALEIGCEGYLLKESSIEELKQAIRSVYNGYKHIGNSVFSQIKQLSMANRAIAVSERNFTTIQESDRTGLLTASIIGSEELDFENFGIDNFKTDKQTLTKVPQSKETPDSLKTLPEAQTKNWFHNFSSSIFLMSLGCVAGIVGIISLGDRNSKSFQPITESGTVRGNTVAIKSPYSGKVKEHNYKVGDLVEANEVLAEIEPSFTKQKQQDIAEVARQIEETINKLNAEKQLLIELKSQVNKEQEKIQQLSVESKAKTSDRADRDKLQSKVKVAFSDYQRLQKLNQQKIVSQTELERAKQVWKSLESELIQNQNSLGENLSNSSTVDRSIGDRLQLELQENISQLQTKVNKKENTVEVLKERLNNFKKHLYDLKNSDRQQQLVDIKAPVKGVIYQIDRDSNQQINRDKAVVQLLDCQNLWIEVTVDNSFLQEVDLQQAVVFHLKDYQHNLMGKISSIESISKLEQTNTNFPYYKTSILNTYLDENIADREMLFKIKIDVPFLENYTQQRKNCGVEENGTVTFNHRSYNS